MTTFVEGGVFCVTCYTTVTRPHIHHPDDRPYFERELSGGAQATTERKPKEPTVAERLAAHRDAQSRRMGAGVPADHPFPGELSPYDLVALASEMDLSEIINKPATLVHKAEFEDPDADQHSNEYKQALAEVASRPELVGRQSW